MVDLVAAFGRAADRLRRGFPDGVVVVPVADDGVGDLVQQRVLDLGPGRPVTVAHRQIDALVDVTADAGAHRGQVEAEAPVRIQPALGLVAGEETAGQRLDVGQRALPLADPFDDREEGVGHLPPDVVTGRHDGAGALQLGDGPFNRLTAPPKSHAAPDRTG